MTPSEAYGAFAYAFDAALGQAFFEGLTPLLDRIVPAGGGEQHLDLACGTGLALEYFASRGFHSTGLDASVSMLALASRRSARVLAADMRAVPLRRSFDLVTCFYDSVNHLLSHDDLFAMFRSVREVMVDGARFIFDINHPEVFPRIWGARDPYTSAGDDHQLEILTRYSRLTRSAVGRVRGWARVEGKRESIDEVRRQRAWSQRAVEKALLGCGFRVGQTLDFDPFSEGGKVKVIYVAVPA